jgi:hypothetical protein
MECVQSPSNWTSLRKEKVLFQMLILNPTSIEWFINKDLSNGWKKKIEKKKSYLEVSSVSDSKIIGC